jgi:cell division protein FtsW
MAVRLRTDRWLFVVTLLMVFFGLVMVYSATSVPFAIRAKDPAVPAWTFPAKQLIAVLIGFGALMFLKRRNYTELQTHHWAFAPFGVVLMLLAVAFFMDDRAHRWIRWGKFLQLQPSELAKPALALFLAWLVVRKGQQVNDRQALAPFLLMMAALAGIVILGDLGTAMVLTATAAAVMFVAGLNRRYFIALAAMAFVVLVLGILSKEYRRDRVVQYVKAKAVKLAPYDPTGIIVKYAPPEQIREERVNYQAEQSVITLGSGGLLGVGLMDGRQKMFFLPEAHTDYIFAHIGEEMGFLACFALLAAFLIILWRGFRLFWIAADPFGQYLALAVTVSIVFQALFNMTVVMDLIPSKGLTLPLISYGGSSIISTLVSLGILMSVSEHAG